MHFLLFGGGLRESFSLATILYCSRSDAARAHPFIVPLGRESHTFFCYV